MGMGKESGIYMSVGLDSSELIQDMAKLRAQAGNAGEQISKALGGSLTTAKLRNDIVGLTTDLSKATAAAKNLNVPIKLDGLDAVARNAGIATTKVNDLYGAMVNTANAKAYENALAHIQKQAGLTSVEMIKLRRETGDVSGALKQAMGALNTRSQSTIVADMKEVVATFKEVRRNADSTAADIQRASTAMRESLKRLATEARGVKVAPTANMSGIQQALAQVQASTRLTTQEVTRLNAEATRLGAQRDLDGAFARIKSEAGLSTLQLARLRAEAGDVRGAFGTLAAGVGQAKVAILAVSASVMYAAKACLDSTLQLDRMNKAYTSIAGSSTGAVVQLDYIHDTANRLGLQFQTTAEAAKGFFSAGKGTTLEPELNRIFESVNTAGAALSLTTDQVQGSFLALGQMISKGKVQAEELRGQLGERLPGAFKFAAQAMNMTTAELDKFMADGKLTADVLLPRLATVLQNEFGAAAVSASQGVQGAVNRLSTEWNLFKASLIESSAAVAGINGVRAAVQGLDAVFNTLAEYSGVLKGLAVGAGVAAGLSGIAVAIKACLPLLSALTTAFSVNSALILAGGLKAATTALKGLSAAMWANPVGAFIVGMGAGASALYWYTQSIDVAVDAQRALDDAQRASIVVNKDFADSQKGYTEALNDRLNAAKQTHKALEDALASLFDKLKESNSFDTTSLYGQVMSITGDFTGKLRELLEEVGKTGDFEKFNKSLSDLELEARAAGKFVDNFADKMKDAQDIGALGVKLDITISGWEETVRKLQGIALFQKTYGVSYEEISPNKNHANANELRDAQNHTFFTELATRFKATEESKRSEIIKTIETTELEIATLERRGLTEQTQLEARTKLTAILHKAQKELQALDNKGNKGNTGLEQARRNADAYTAELDKTMSSVTALKAQLAAPAGDMFTRDQVKINKDYDQTLIAINKQVKEYEGKKGISKAQAQELETAKKLEAQHNRDLALRDLQNKNAEIRLDFEKRYADMVGATSQGIVESIRKQSAEYASAGADRVRLAEWERDQIQRASTAAWDGAAVALRDYSAEAGNQAKGMNEAFTGLFTGIDSGFGNMWSQMLEDGKVSLSEFRKLFANFMADLLHMAITRPITVSIAGVVSGALGFSTGTAQAAQAAQAAGGGGFSIPGFNGSSLFNGISDTINESMMNWFPSTFGTGMVTNFAGSAGSLTSGTLSTAAINSIGGSGYGGMAFAPGANLPTFTSSIAPALGWGSAGSAVGGMVSPYFNNMLGINNGKNAQIGSTVGGLGATGVMAGLAAANMWNPGGWVMAGVSALSSLFGGSMGGMFDKKPKRPAVWGGAEIDLGSDNLYAPGSYDFGATFDPKGYGRDSFEMYEDGNYAIATRSRNKASSDVAKAMSQIMREVAEMGVKQADAVQEALPDSYAAAFKEQLSANTISAEWDFKGDDINEESFKQAAAELQEKVNASMLSAFQGMDFAEYAGKINVDQSAIEGLNKFTTAIKLTEETIQSTAEIANPISQLEQQANAAKAQLDEWTKAMKTAGVTTEYAGQLMTDYSSAMINKFIGDMEESLNPLSQYAQAMKDANTAVDDRLAALTVLGATEAELARVEGLRAQVLEQTTGPMKLAFEQDLQVRQAQLSGNAELLASTQLTIQHERELAEIRAKFGQDSSQFEQIEAMQVAEKAQLAWQQAQARGLEVLQNQAKAAQSALDAMNTALSEANSALSSAQQALDKARNAYLSALNKEASAIQSTMDAVSRAVEQLSRTRRDLLTSAEMSPLGTAERYALSGAELERVFTKAMSGDAEAMNELAGLSSKYLDVSKEANADFSKYRKDFERVQAMLAAVETSGNVQISESQKQIDLLNAQIAAATEGTAQIVGSIKEMEAAFLQALGDYNAAQEAARKAQEAAEEARRKAEEAANNAQNSSGNSQKSWMQDVLERKAAQLNSVGEASWGVSAGNWTPDEVLRAIFGNGLTFESWYKQFGQIEGFAKGGLASGWAMVGEEGPELVNFSNPGRVYTADDTANMLNPRQSFQAPALSVSLPQTGNSNAELIVEIKALRREVAELRADQSRSQFRIADATQRTARKLEGWDYDGLPEERKQ